MAGLTLTAVEDLAGRSGLRVRGAFHPTAEDRAPATAATLVLLGFVGNDGWRRFAGSPEARDGEPHPLDRWSRRLIDGIAADLDAAAVYPFGGPPYHPFQRWAQRGDRVFVSPLGILIHPDFGLWHSYRGALVVTERLELPIHPACASPCATCAEKPCLTRCPVAAFSARGYDVDRCRTHISTETGADCMSIGCLARNACPVGAEHGYAPAQAAFHMRAFRRG